MPKARREYWAELIAEQEASGQTAAAFCRKHGLCAHTFYAWRRRVSTGQGVHFAVVESKPAVRDNGAEAALELILANGERLRIGRGTDAATLRLVLDAIRA